MKSSVFYFGAVLSLLLAGCGGVSTSSGSSVNPEAVNPFLLKADDADYSPEEKKFPVNVTLSNSTFSPSISPDMLSLGGSFSNLKITSMERKDATHLSLVLEGQLSTFQMTSQYLDGKVTFSVDAIAGSELPAVLSCPIEDSENYVDEKAFKIEDSHLVVSAYLSDDHYAATLSPASFAVGGVSPETVVRVSDQNVLLYFPTGRSDISLAVKDLFTNGAFLSNDAAALEHEHSASYTYTFCDLDINALLPSLTLGLNGMVATIDINVVGGKFVPDAVNEIFVFDDVLSGFTQTSFTMNSSFTSGVIVASNPTLDSFPYDLETIDLNDSIYMDTGMIEYPWGEAEHLQLGRRSFALHDGRAYPSLSSGPSDDDRTSFDYMSLTYPKTSVGYDKGTMGDDASGNGIPDYYYFDAAHIFHGMGGYADRSKAEASLDMIAATFETVSKFFEVGGDNTKVVTGIVGGIGDLCKLGGMISRLVGATKTTSPAEIAVKALRAIMGGISQLSSQISQLSHKLDILAANSTVTQFVRMLDGISAKTNTVNNRLYGIFHHLHDGLEPEVNENVGYYQECAAVYMRTSSSFVDYYISDITDLFRFIRYNCNPDTDGNSSGNPFHAIEVCFSNSTIFLNEAGSALLSLREMARSTVLEAFFMLTTLELGVSVNDAAPGLTGSALQNDIETLLKKRMERYYTEDYIQASRFLNTYCKNFHYGTTPTLIDAGYYSYSQTCLVYSTYCFPLHTQVAVQVFRSWTTDSQGQPVPNISSTDFGLTNFNSGWIPVALRDRYFRPYFYNGSLGPGEVRDYCDILNRFYNCNWYQPYLNCGAPDLSEYRFYGGFDLKNLPPDPWSYRFGVRGYYDGGDKWGCYDTYWRKGEGLGEDDRYHLTYPADKDLGLPGYRWTLFYI
jgi:hypothetical protein